MDLDTQVGWAALQYFHNASVGYSGYGLNWSEFQNQYNGKMPIYAEGVGLVINSTQLSDSKVRSVMENLAAQAQGRLPANPLAFNNALGNKAQQIDWLDLTETVAGETAVTVAGGFADFGGSLLSGLSTLNVLLPFILVGAPLYYIWHKLKKASE